MRILIVAAAAGLVLGAPVLAPTGLMSAAVAQTDATLPPAEQATVDAAIDAVMADTTLTTAQIQAQIAAIIQGSSDPVAATRRVIAKANQPSTSTDLAEALGGGVAQVVNTLQSSDPQTAAGLQTVVAVEGSVNVQVGYTSPQPFTPTTPTTTTPTPVVVTGDETPPPPPGPPPVPVVPTIPEPNPAQIVPVEVILAPGSPT